MHPNTTLLTKLFTALNRHDHDAMAACYCDDAHFRDIAFDLNGREGIHAMWRMICSGDIQASFEVVEADDRIGRVKLVDKYTFRKGEGQDVEKRPVTNPIDSRFVFRGGLIAEHIDDCDSRAWAEQAIGGAAGFLAGRLRFLRKWKAEQKLDAFTKQNKARAAGAR